MSVSRETPPESSASPPLSRVALVASFLLPIVLLAPFANKAYHIDDPLQLWTAQHIHEEPLNFSGFDIVWYSDTQPMHEVNQNPPGTPYLLALVARVFGWGEIPLHLTMALVAGLLGLGTCLLASQLGVPPSLSVAIAVLTPAFLVSANTVMTDVPMVMLYVWGISLWLRGLDRHSHVLLFAAAACIALSTLNKYFGITAVPLLLAYSFALKRKPGSWLAHLLLPIAVLGLYQWWTYHLYGQSLFSGAAGYAFSAAEEGKTDPLGPRTLVGLMFAGGSLISTLLFAPFIWNRKAVAGGLAATVLVGVLMFYRPTLVIYTQDIESFVRVLLAAHGALFTIAGVHVLLLAVAEMWQRRDATAYLLGLWIVGTFVFATYLNWSVNVRVMLPMLVPAAILVARRVAAREAPIGRPQLVAALGASAAIALSVTWADYRLADTGREAALKFAGDRGMIEERYYYEGHWGFQYYADHERIPYMLKDYEQYLRTGDRIVVPKWSSVRVDYGADRARVIPELGYEKPASRWITTMHPLRGAGFYSHTLGPLPYVFAPALPVEYDVYQLGIYGPR